MQLQKDVKDVENFCTPCTKPQKFYDSEPILNQNFMLNEFLSDLIDHRVIKCLKLL